MVLVAAASARATGPLPVAEAPGANSSDNGRRAVMKRVIIGITTIAMGLTVAAPAHADPDTDFTNELHTYGIYGQKDRNAWIGKITCKRLRNGVDVDAYKSAWFVQTNLDKDTTTEQAWQFLGAALRTYCPDKMPILQQAAQ
jgi:hypothetical protein